MHFCPQDAFIPRTKKIFLTAVCLIAIMSSLYAQTPQQRQQIRLSIWAELDAFPGKFEDSAQAEQAAGSVQNGGTKQAESKSDNKSADKEASSTANSTSEPDLFSFAISRAKEITPFLLSGMLSGWEFEYVPYDKTRQVSEFFEFSEIAPFDFSVNSIEYRNPFIDQDSGKLLCWAYCTRTPTQVFMYDRWKSIVHPKIKGQGTGMVEDGFEGIKQACSEAVKNAVREYWRTLTKNKPKEISGKVLLIENPRIYIKEGRYVVDLDFFLETDRILLYSYY